MYSLSFNPVEKIDFAFLFIIGVSFAILAFITFLMIYFLIRYRRSKNPEPAQIEGNTILEITWTVVPLIIVFFMFYFGWSGLKALRNVPEDAFKVTVKARMWSWLFEYENGKKSNKLYVPVNRPVLLELTSEDVIHSFYAPAFRIKIDTVPGMKTYAWFKPEKIGEYDILCAEYCGRGHANMLSKIIVKPENQFVAWLKEGGKHVAEGKNLFENYGCSSCHSVNGEKLEGPNLRDIIGRETTIIRKGKELKIVVDDNYFKESVFFPEKEIVKGYNAIMPSYDGQISEEELEKIIEYLGGEGNEKEESKGYEIAEREGCFSCHSTDGSLIVGPTFKGLLNRTTKVKSGKSLKTIKADEDYIVDSILEPSEYIVDGFDNIMPSYKNLSDEEIKNLLDYIKSISE
jgi:cytochrome c oxidase subunit 2